MMAYLIYGDEWDLIFVHVHVWMLPWEDFECCAVMIGAGKRLVSPTFLRIFHFGGMLE